LTPDSDPLSLTIDCSGAVTADARAPNLRGIRIRRTGVRILNRTSISSSHPTEALDGARVWTESASRLARLARTILLGVLAATCLALAWAVPASAEDWTVGEIAGPAGTTRMQPAAVNANAEVVGNARFQGRDEDTAFWWRDLTAYNLGGADDGGFREGSAAFGVRKKQGKPGQREGGGKRAGIGATESGRRWG
jgi:hypothetical protein